MSEKTPWTLDAARRSFIEPNWCAADDICGCDRCEAGRLLVARIADQDAQIESLQNKWASRPLSSEDQAARIGYLEAQLRSAIDMRDGYHRAGNELCAEKDARIAELETSERRRIAGQIMGGFTANPSVFASNRNSGWALVNCSDNDFAGYVVHLADALIAALDAKP